MGRSSAAPLRIVPGAAIALAFFLVGANAIAADDRATLLPHFRAGDTFTYQIRLRINKHIRSQSRVASPAPPDLGPVDIARAIRIEVLAADSANPRANLKLRVRIEDAAATPPAPKSFDFSINGDGSVTPPKEAAALSAEDADAWRAWLARFAIAWTIPEKGLKLGEKWNAEEPISGMPLAQLSWQKESQYVRDEPCPVTQSAGERCAVLLTTAILKQRSSPKDATPDDYRQRELKTMGTAKGRNNIFTYISLATGLLVRSSEDADQTMDVLIAKSDGSNQVHYYVDAKSSTSMLLILPSL